MTKLTHEDMRDAVFAYRDQHGAQASRELLAAFGYAGLNRVEEKDFQAIIDAAEGRSIAVQGRPGAHSVDGATIDADAVSRIHAGAAKNYRIHAGAAKNYGPGMNPKPMKAESDWDKMASAVRAKHGMAEPTPTEEPEEDADEFDADPFGSRDVLAKFNPLAPEKGSGGRET